MMQTDVRTSHLNGTGQLVVGRTRLKQLMYLGTGTAGGIIFFDTITAPSTATYGRTSFTVTVTQTAHGYKVGQSVGIDFAAGTGGTATDGNYVIATVPTADTYTITDINSGSITAGASCIVANAWMAAYDTSTAIQPFQLLLPGEGVLATQGIYAYCTNINFASVAYG